MSGKKFMRFGRFSLPRQMLDSFDTGAKRVMGLCIILRAEYDYAADRINYIASSEHFREVAEFELIPEYAWVISDEDGIRAEEKPWH
jgi:hypothetical protein